MTLYEIVLKKIKKRNSNLAMMKLIFFFFKLVIIKFLEEIKLIYLLKCTYSLF